MRSARSSPPLAALKSWKLKNYLDAGQPLSSCRRVFRIRILGRLRSQPTTPQSKTLPGALFKPAPTP
jgi:hypothetical protein